MRQDETELRYTVSCYSGISRPGPLPLLPSLYCRGTALRAVLLHRDRIDERPSVWNLIASGVPETQMRGSIGRNLEGT